MPKIDFTKVVGSGNDFIVIDNRSLDAEKTVKDLSSFAVYVCRRKLSIGADGLLVLGRADKADFRMRIFNPDGSEASMCGNGARCASSYAVAEGWCAKSLKIETGAGIVEADVNGSNVKLKMTDPHHITLDKDIGIEKSLLKTHFIDTGVPHVVHFTERLDNYPVREIGAQIRNHKAFSPGGANANFVKVLGENKIKVRTYERGVEDETLACGTGSVAAAIISHLVNGTKPPVKVLTASGDVLTVYFNVLANKVSNVYLEGEAKIVFKGGIEYV